MVDHQNLKRTFALLKLQSEVVNCGRKNGFVEPVDSG
jgi:hypothetical protein